MRVSPVAWFEDKEHRVMELAKLSAEVTHSHPEGIKGAQATAMAILWAGQGSHLTASGAILKLSSGTTFRSRSMNYERPIRTTKLVSGRCRKFFGAFTRPQILRIRYAMRSVLVGTRILWLRLPGVLRKRSGGAGGDW